MLEKKGRNVVILDVAELTDISNFFVICSCESDVQVRAVAEHVQETLGESDIRPWKTEGWNSRTWVILDYVDFVIHVFHDEARRFYNLERLWADAPVEYVEDQVQDDIGTLDGGTTTTAEKTNDDAAEEVE